MCILLACCAISRPLEKRHQIVNGFVSDSSIRAIDEPSVSISNMSLGGLISCSRVYFDYYFGPSSRYFDPRPSRDLELKTPTLFGFIHRVSVQLGLNPIFYTFPFRNCYIGSASTSSHGVDSNGRKDLMQINSLYSHDTSQHAHDPLNLNDLNPDQYSISNIFTHCLINSSVHSTLVLTDAPSHQCALSIIEYDKNFIIRKLQLHGVVLDVSSVDAIVLILVSTNIQRLRLDPCNIGAELLTKLFRSIPLSKLTSFFLSARNNAVDRLTCEVISSILPQTQLTSLSLLYVGFDDVGVGALARSLLDTSIASLNLKGNNLGDAGVIAFASICRSSKLTSLNLESNRVTDHSTIVISDLLTRSQLTHLKLGRNQLTASGVRQIASVLPFTNLERLSLSASSVQDDGAVWIANALPLSKLTHLDLSDTELSDAGANEIAMALNQTQLQRLILRDNRFHSAARHALHTISHQCGIRLYL